MGGSVLYEAMAKGATSHQWILVSLEEIISSRHTSSSKVNTSPQRVPNWRHCDCEGWWAPRNRWSLARIEEVYPSDDKHVHKMNLWLVMHKSTIWECESNLSNFLIAQSINWYSSFLQSLKGLMKSIFIKLYFLVLLYWWVWIKNNVKCFFCVEWIINCLSNNQKLTPEFSKF